MKKNYIIAIIFVAMYSLTMFLLLYGHISNKTDEFYLLFEDQQIIYFSNNKWNTMISKEFVNSNKFLVYENNKYIGKYDIRFHKQLYLFDNNRESIKISGDFFATCGKNKVDVINFEISTIDSIDDKYLKKIIKKYDLKINNIDDLEINEKILLDFDNDGILEELYFISNMFKMEVEKQGFSFVYYIDDNNINMIFETIVQDGERLDSYSYGISNIIDYDHDGNLEIIITNGQYRPYTPCRSIYKLKRGKYVAEKSCD
ncbi:MAG: hypothetical protein IJO57_01260 [Bacilli bacterium]|nr:hypothetical protein [Bacilli bacterium]